MRRVWLGLAVVCALLPSMVSVAAAQQPKVLVYSGTTGYRHAGNGEAIQPAVVELIQSRLQAAGIESDYRTCNGTANCRATNPDIFTSANLANYDAIFFWQASSRNRDDTTGQRLFTDSEQAAIEEFARSGGGIAAMHASVTMGAGQVTWPWWDAPGDSAIGALMPGHSATDINNVATVEVSDRHHPSTRDLPDSFRFGDEHYTFSSNPRGTHHVLMTLDEESYNVGNGVTRMGADHPIAWCRMYEGARVWVSSLGHFSASYLENGGDNNLMKHLVGGVRWAAGTAGKDSDCGGTVWSNFARTVLADDLRGPIGLDIARDGKVYWTEIGNQGLQSEGRLRMYDPATRATSTLLTLQTRADHESSNDGVLGMALDPRDDRKLYIYYSPRQDPGCNSCIVVGHNVISRFTLNAEGTAVLAGSEQEILRIPKVKVGNDNSDGVPGQNTYSAHVGGGSLSFDADGNLYIGTGDDVDPFGQGGNGYAPLDQRYPERYDARNTSANTNDLRGKILRIRPRPDATGTPGAGTTYDIPPGNMFAPGTAQTKPEIFAMGFRNPFTVQADPAHPGTVVVGDYGPDAGSNSATRGPAGIIEWNRVTEPGFYGWPFCAGDNSPANSYFRYTFPSGPSGARFDCAAAQIPNESPNNTGLSQLPGPAVAADVWHKRTGEHPARFAIPSRTTPQEAITGPIYRYDESNPSDTKWPAYYDGAWLMLDRAQNWWRETRVKDDGSGILRVNGMFDTSQFGTPGHTFPIPVKFGPDGSLYLATWGFDCCRSQLPASQNGRLMRIDFIGDQEDTTAPVVEATVEGPRNGAGEYLGRATLRLNATDASGVSRTEYSLDGETWTRYEEPVAFTARGTYAVRYRATDRAGNTSEEQLVTFTVVAGEACLPARSDEFSGALDTERWSFRHPTSAVPTVSAGELVLPLGAYSVDLTRPGPIGFVGQSLPGGDFSVVTKVTAPGLNADTGGQGSQYAQAGLKIFQTDDNWIKISLTRNADGNPTGAVNTYFELAYETNGTRTLGTRMGLGNGNLPTYWLRVDRSGATVTAYYSLGDPDGAGANWVSLGTANLDTVLPAGAGPRYVGPYGGNGSISVRYDYFRVTPDNPSDAAPPVTSHSLPAGDWHREPVDVTLTAVEDGECVSGVERTEYRIGDGAFTTYSAPVRVSGDGEHTLQYRSVDKAGNVEDAKSVVVRIDGTPPATTASLDGTGPVTLTLDASDPLSGVATTEYRVNAAVPFGAVGAARFAESADWVTYSASAKPVFTLPGPYTVEYRSTDVAGNVEAIKTVTFTIAGTGQDTTAPVTTATLDPGPVATRPVTVRLSATDPVGQAPEPKTVDVEAFGTTWEPNAVSLVAGDRITWRFGVNAGTAHDVWLVPPGADPSPAGGELIEVSGIVFPGGEPVTRAFTQPGTWTFVCRLHAAFVNGAWDGMTGTAVVAPAGAAPSGVDYTEYRVDGGDWVRRANTGAVSPFVNEFAVADAGQHTVEYRSADKAGNVESVKSVGLRIDAPEPGDPVIEAFADPAAGAAPLLVRYTAMGYDPDGGELTWKWQFSDGTSLLQNVTRTYRTPGTYTATVTATDDEGDSTSKEITVTVTAPGVIPPTVSASADVTSGPAPLPVRFEASGADPDGDASKLTYAWDFGDGGSSFAQSPAHTYMEPGTYTATVTVRDPSGAVATDSVTVTVSDPPGNVAPSVQAAALPSSGEAPLTVILSAAGTDPDGDKLTYTWDFDDGSTGSGAEVTHVYAQAGTYRATVTASDGHGGTATATVDVVVGNPPGNQAPTVAAAADPVSGTAPLTVRFTAAVRDPDGDGYLVVWNFGDGGQAGGEAATHTYTQPGVYDATVRVTDARGGVATATVQVVVAAPAAVAAPRGDDGGGAAVAPAAAPSAWFGVAKPARTTVARFASRGLKVRVTCTTAMKGSAALKVPARTARALGLRSRTVARGTVRCAGAGTRTVTLKPSRSVARTVAAGRRSVRATLEVRMRGSKATRAVTLAR